MKASRLIAQLQIILDNHGDLEVYGAGYDAEGFAEPVESVSPNWDVGTAPGSAPDHALISRYPLPEAN